MTDPMFLNASGLRDLSQRLNRIRAHENVEHEMTIVRASIELDEAARRLDALAAERDRADRAEALTDAKVERAAKAMFEAGGVVEGDWTWADVVGDEAGRAELWRNDARQVLAASLSTPEATA